MLTTTVSQYYKVSHLPYNILRHKSGKSLEATVSTVVFRGVVQAPMPMPMGPERSPKRSAAEAAEAKRTTTRILTKSTAKASLTEGNSDLLAAGHHIRDPIAGRATFSPQNQYHRDHLAASSGPKRSQRFVVEETFRDETFSGGRIPTHSGRRVQPEGEGGSNITVGSPTGCTKTSATSGTQKAGNLEAADPATIRGPCCRGDGCSKAAKQHHKNAPAKPSPAIVEEVASETTSSTEANDHTQPPDPTHPEDQLAEDSRSSNYNSTPTPGVQIRSRGWIGARHPGDIRQL
ncbi:hypothetical protein Trydic_g22588 [Trypoxylus dichotomus]